MPSVQMGFGGVILVQVLPLDTQEKCKTICAIILEWEEQCLLYSGGGCVLFMNKCVLTS